MDLALADHRVDGHAEIIDGGKAVDAHRAGFRIDFHLADLAAVRIIGRAAGHARPGADAVKAKPELKDRPRRRKERAGHVADRHPFVGADHREGAGVEFDVGGGRFQQRARHFLAAGR